MNEQNSQNTKMLRYDRKGLTIHREFGASNVNQNTKISTSQTDDDNDLENKRTTTTTTECLEIKKDFKLPTNLPEIENIAQKLNKVSLLTLPDSQLLNVLPNNLQSQIKIELRPKRWSKSLQSNTLKNVKVLPRSKKRKDPKFVPFEPYKGCVKPLFKKVTKKSTTKLPAQVLLTQADNKCKIVSTNDGDSSKLWCRLNDTIAEFEKEKTQWEEERKHMEIQQVRLRDDLSRSTKHCECLEQQLATQSQVNSELKKLLVASVGEDVQSRVQCLTEDKARMSHMIRRYSEKVDRDYEERERMGIQCDVWHSKFLASSLLLDDLAKSKAILNCQLYDAQDAMTVVMEEYSICQKQILQTYKLLQQIRDAFDPLCADGSHVLTSADLLTSSVTAVDQAEWLRDRLLGNLGRAVGCSNPRYDELQTLTPGEKMVTKVLEEIRRCYQKENGDDSAVVGRSSMVHRYHPNAKYDHITVNCCSHCNGDIKVV